MLWYASFLIVLAAVVLFAAVVVGFFFRVMFFRIRKIERRFEDEDMWEIHFGRYADRAIPVLKKMRDAACDEVSVRSFDGLLLSGRFYRAENPKGVFILVHGYRSCGFYDFCGIFDFLRQEGYHILLIDQRAHGKSQGRYIGYGIPERGDCLRWTKWVSSHYPSLPVFLYGVSMGCASVLMASGFSLPENVRGIVADCGYTKPVEIFKSVAGTNFRLPRIVSRPLIFVTVRLCRLVAGFSPDAYSTLDAMKNNRLPVLFIHGKRDRFVPFRMTLENYRVCRAEKELFPVENASHAMSVFEAPEMYRAKLKAFTDKYGSRRL